MMSETALPGRALPDPDLLEPRHGHVADGAHLAFHWAPVPDARRYRVQVAEGPGFDDVLFEQELPAWATALVVRQRLPEDDRTLHWRVQAGDDAGWSPGGHVERFLSGRADQVGMFADPDESEPFGPVAALFQAATLEALAEVLPGRQPSIERALGDEHPEGVEAAEILTTEVILLLALAAVLAVGGLLLLAAC